MALPQEYQREAPAFTLVAQYAVGRINEFPSLRVSYDEVVYLAAESAVVVTTADLDADTRFEVLNIPGFEDRADLVGRSLCLADSTFVGTVLSAVRVEPTVGEAYLQVTLTEGVVANLAGEVVSLIATMPIGTLAYRKARAGFGWELLLDGSNPASMARMGLMLGTAYVKALKAGLAALGLTSVTDLQILGAVQALAVAGINLDGILAAEGEQLETDRRSGAFTAVTVFGNAP